MNEQIKAIIDRARVLLAAATPGPVTVYPHPRPSEGFDESRFQWGDLTTWGRSVWTGIPMVDAEVSAFAVNNLATLCDALEAAAAPPRMLIEAKPISPEDTERLRALLAEHNAKPQRVTLAPFESPEVDALKARVAEIEADRAAVADAMGIQRAGLDDVEFQAVIEERAPTATALTVAELQRESYETARAKGWHDEDETPPAPIRIVAWMGLICSEAAEAIEDARKGRMVTTIREDGKPEGLGSELADIIIRVCDSAGALGIDMEAELRAKLAFNRTRGHRHGGKLA